MLKWTATVIRQEHVLHDELVDVWEHVHAPHVVKISKPEAYRITFFDSQDAPYDPGVDGPTNRDMTKLVYFVKRSPEIDRSDLDKCWLDVHITNVAAAVNRAPSAVRYSVDAVNPKRDMVYEGIAQLTFDSTDTRFNDLQGCEPNGSGELVKPLLAARGCDLRIVD